MARSNTRELTITLSKGGFEIFKKKSSSKEDYDFSGISSLRRLLSNEKARILNIIKNHEPASIYELSKKLGRGFKSVLEDVRLLERFGFIDLVEEKHGKRKRLRPRIVVDSILLNIKI